MRHFYTSLAGTSFIIAAIIIFTANGVYAQSTTAEDTELQNACWCTKTQGTSPDHIPGLLDPFQAEELCQILANKLESDANKVGDYQYDVTGTITGRDPLTNDYICSYEIFVSGYVYTDSECSSLISTPGWSNCTESPNSSPNNQNDLLQGIEKILKILW